MRKGSIFKSTYFRKFFLELLPFWRKSKINVHYLFMLKRLLSYIFTGHVSDSFSYHIFTLQNVHHVWQCPCDVTKYFASSPTECDVIYVWSLRAIQIIHCTLGVNGAVSHIVTWNGEWKLELDLKMHAVPSVNFINVKRAHFSYKSILRNFSLITVLLCNFLAQEYRRKCCLSNVDEIDYLSV